MLKIKLNNKLGQVKVGNASFDLKSLKGVKKEDFEKKHKGLFDTKSVWKELKKYTK